MNEWVAYNSETGEIRSDAKISLPEDIKKRRDYLIKKNKCDSIQSLDKSYFKFFISHFEQITDLDAATLARLMYISTYVSYDDNYLKYQNGIKIKKKDILNLIGLSEKTSRVFYNTVVQKGYLIEMEDGIVVNKKIIHKGYDENRPLDDTERYNKIYIKAMQKLYQSVRVTQHKFLGYIFQMLPYLNIYNNILCYNPFEQNIDLIQPINMIDLCQRIGLSFEHVTQFRRNVEKVIFNFNGKEQHFMCYVLPAEADNKNQGMIMINPNVLYSRSIIERESMIDAFFSHELSNRIKEARREQRRKRKELKAIETNAIETDNHSLIEQKIKG